MDYTGNNIQQLMTLFMLASGINPTYVMLLPLIFSFLITFYKKINDCFKKKLVSFDINNSDSTGYPIEIYYDVTWYIIHNNLLKYPQLEINENWGHYNNLIDDHKKIVHHDKINTKYKNEDVFINFSTKKSGKEKFEEYCVITLSSNKLSIIEDFIKMCCEQHKKYRRSNRKIISTCNFESSKWISSKLKVMKTFDNLFLSKELENYIKNDINSYLNNKQLYKEVGISYKRGFLFFGKPGCGKTSCINAIARLINYDIYKIKLGNIQDSKTLFKAVSNIPSKSILVMEDIDRLNCVNNKYGLTSKITIDKIIKYEKQLNKLFSLDNIDFNNLDLSFFPVMSLIKNNENPDLSTFGSSFTINTFIDGITKTLQSISNKPDIISNCGLDKLYNNKSNGGNFNITDIMEIFDGNEYLHKCLIIITSNYPEKLDRALIRPGRIDTKVEFEPADHKTITKILSTFYNTPLQQIKKDLGNFNKRIEQSMLINSMILPNIENYKEAINLILNY